jgi:DNA-binding transcriptional MerR regulator
MRSGELARRSGVSTDTLRHYERLRLLPKPPRTAGGYRDYPESAAERVRLIRGALNLGFSLSDMREILALRDKGGVPCRKTLETARARLKELDGQVDELLRARRQLQRVVESWEDRIARTPEGRPARLLESLPEGQDHGRTAATLRVRRNTS